MNSAAYLSALSNCPELERVASYSLAGGGASVVCLGGGGACLPPRNVYLFLVLKLKVWILSKINVNPQNFRSTNKYESPPLGRSI